MISSDGAAILMIPESQGPDCADVMDEIPDGDLLALVDGQLIPRRYRVNETCPLRTCSEILPGGQNPPGRDLPKSQGASPD